MKCVKNGGKNGGNARWIKVLLQERIPLLVPYFIHPRKIKENKGGRKKHGTKRHNRKDTCRLQ